MNRKYSCQRSHRRGLAAVELLFVFVTFVFAFFIMFNLGKHVIEFYFHDGNQATSSPLI